MTVDFFLSPSRASRNPLKIEFCKQTRPLALFSRYKCSYYMLGLKLGNRTVVHYICTKKKSDDIVNYLDKAIYDGVIEIVYWPGDNTYLFDLNKTLIELVIVARKFNCTLRRLSNNNEIENLVFKKT